MKQNNSIIELLILLLSYFNVYLTNIFVWRILLLTAPHTLVPLAEKARNGT